MVVEHAATAGHLVAVAPRLESFFVGAAGKLLSAVEAHPNRSNQHEFNGVAPLAALLGDPPEGGRRFRTIYVFLDDDMEPSVVESTATWYDARANHPTRSEFRLYYPPNEVMNQAVAGDYMVMARSTLEVESQHSELVVIVSPSASSVAAQLQELFGLEPTERLDVEVLPAGHDLNYTSRQLLEALGFDVEIADERFLNRLMARFGAELPATHAFSAFARETLPEVDAREDPDAALLAWWEREEVLFRTFERHLLSELITGAGTDVEEILRIAMSAFQRRKSRAGHALENHVAKVLSVWQIPFDAQPKTEGKVRPDFLVPGAAAYQDPTFDPRQLRMLAVKTTCKDRWRQILSEAARIPRKHLLTLEAPISNAQTNEMHASSVVLVTPGPLHGLFEPSQQVASLRTMLAEFDGGGGL